MAQVLPMIPEPPQDPHHQLKKWLLMVDWWTGQIIPSIVDEERAKHATAQVYRWRDIIEAEGSDID